MFGNENHSSDHLLGADYQCSVKYYFWQVHVQILHIPTDKIDHTDEYTVEGVESYVNHVHIINHYIFLNHLVLHQIDPWHIYHYVDIQVNEIV